MANESIDIRVKLLNDFARFCGVKGSVNEGLNITSFEPDNTTEHPFMVHYDGCGIELVHLVYPDDKNDTPRDYDIIYKCRDLKELKQVYNVVSKAKIFKW